jgi:hypothetical protein
LRRDRPQASRSRHRRAGRPMLGPPDPRLLRRRGSGSFQVPGSGPMPRRCPEFELATPRQRPSAPRFQGGRMLAADGCASSSSDPACCFCGVWVPAGRGSGGRHVRALTRLGMPICRCEYSRLIIGRRLRVGFHPRLQCELQAAPDLEHYRSVRLHGKKRLPKIPRSGTAGHWLVGIMRYLQTKRSNLPKSDQIPR